MEDALTGLGHACGHNLIAVSSVGAALATAEVVKKHDLGGRVVLFGTPAEGTIHGSFAVGEQFTDVSQREVVARFVSLMPELIATITW